MSKSTSYFSTEVFKALQNDPFFQQGWNAFYANIENPYCIVSDHASHERWNEGYLAAEEYK